MRSGPHYRRNGVARGGCRIHERPPTRPRTWTRTSSTASRTRGRRFCPPRAVHRGSGRRGQLKPAILANVRPAERTRQARRCGAIETEMTCTASVAVYWTVQSSPLRGPHRGSRDTQSGCGAGSCAYRHRHGPGASASPLQGVQAGVRKHESGHRTGPIGTIEVNAQRAKPCFPLRFSDASSSA